MGAIEVRFSSINIDSLLRVFLLILASINLLAKSMSFLLRDQVGIAHVEFRSRVSLAWWWILCLLKTTRGFRLLDKRYVLADQLILGRRKRGVGSGIEQGESPVSYTHLTLPTKRIV